MSPNPYSLPIFENSEFENRYSLDISRIEQITFNILPNVNLNVNQEVSGSVGLF